MSRRPGGDLRTATIFVLLALGFAWLDWGAVALSRAGVLPFSMESADWFRASVPGTIVSFVLRDFGPALAGLLALALCRGRAGVAELGRRLVRWRFPGWLWLAALFPLAGNLLVVLVGLARGELRPAAAPPSVAKFSLIFLLMAIFDGPLGEETAWRGVLLPELLRRFSAPVAALAVGVVWYLWHVPLYLADGKLGSALEHALFLLSCVFLSAIFTWFFLRSGGSVLLMILLHDLSNFSVVLRRKLFVATTDSPLPTLLLLAWLALLGLAAFAALRRAGRLQPPSTRPSPDSSA